MTTPVSGISKRFLPAVALLLLAALLSLLVEDFFRQIILLPLLELFFVLYRLYRAVPQNLVWAALVVGAVLVALRAIWPGLPEPKQERVVAAHRGRVAELADLLANESNYARWQVMKELEEVCQRTARPSGLETEHGAEGTVPAEVRALLAVCAAAPTYRRFDELRRAGEISALLDSVDLTQVVAAMEGHEQPAGGS